MLTLRDVPKAAVKEAYDYMAVAPKHWQHGICAYMAYDAAGKAIISHMSGDICHAALAENGYRQERDKHDRVELVVTAQTAEQRHRQEEADLAFFRYLSTENPVSMFILNRDDLSSIAEGGVVIDGRSAGSEITLFIAKTFRYANEEQWRVKFWYDFVKQGVHPLVALIAASEMGSNGQQSPGWTHARTFTNPASIEALAHALSIKDFPVQKSYKVGRTETWRVFEPDRSKAGTSYSYYPDTTGIIKIGGAKKKIRVPDGWGGYTEKEVAEDLTLVDHLKDLTKQAEEINSSSKKKSVGRKGDENGRRSKAA